MATPEEILTTAESDPVPAGAVRRAARAATENHYEARALAEAAFAVLVAERSAEPDFAFTSAFASVLYSTRMRDGTDRKFHYIEFAKLADAFELFLLAERPGA
jgi:hypothetical protein